MTLRRPITALALVILGLCAASCTTQETRSGVPEPDDSPVKRAVKFLSREVPAWHRENGCYSCHNNGDAARALMVASVAGFHVPGQSLKDTLDWAAHPANWDQNRGDPAFSDQRLADLQFACSLATAVETRQIHDRKPLELAARRLVGRQAADGSWPVEPGNSLGSPATYGPALATSMAVLALRFSQTKGTGDAVANAERWLSATKPNNVPAAGAVLLAKLGGNSSGKKSQIAQCVEIIRRAENSSGGFGPYPASPSEPFDTAIALLALQPHRGEQNIRAMIERGREYLVKEQLPDGSWPATTRPPGGESYAEKISTTGWATLALLKTRE